MYLDVLKMGPVCVCVCVLAHIMVSVTLSGIDSSFLGVSSHLGIIWDDMYPPTIKTHPHTHTHTHTHKHPSP